MTGVDESGSGDEERGTGDEEREGSRRWQSTVL